MAPWKPANPCSVCRRLQCVDPAHTQKRTRDERERRRRAVANHRVMWGYDYCPGYDRAPHRADDLTADHLEPVATGGAMSGKLQILCRSCNSRKGLNRG